MEGVGGGLWGGCCGVAGGDAMRVLGAGGMWEGGGGCYGGAEGV